MAGVDFRTREWWYRDRFAETTLSVQFELKRNTISLVLATLLSKKNNYDKDWCLPPLKKYSSKNSKQAERISRTLLLEYWPFDWWDNLLLFGIECWCSAWFRGDLSPENLSRRWWGRLWSFCCTFRELRLSPAKSRRSPINTNKILWEVSDASTKMLVPSKPPSMKTCQQSDHPHRHFSSK